MSKSKSRTFVIGDIHGGYKSLIQCLERANFDYSKDKLISLGDLCDGWPETSKVIDELLKIKNLTVVRGNHDQWFLEWLMNEDEIPAIWYKQGGANTIKSYVGVSEEVKNKHLDFLSGTPFYYEDEKNRLFVHGGIEVGIPLHKQDKTFMMWDRSFYDLWKISMEPLKIPGYKMIFVGHTSTCQYSEVPISNGNVVFMDTGGGYENMLSLMDIDTGELFQSDMVEDLYPNVIPR